MPLERYPPDDAREWLNRAKSSLQHARADQDGVYYEDLCFDAQQAAEKALKALLMQRNMPFPYVHDLDALMQLLEEAGLKPPVHVRTAVRLTMYAVAGRCPGLGEPVTREEYLASLAIAEGVVAWAEAVLISPAQGRGA